MSNEYGDRYLLLPKEVKNSQASMWTCYIQASNYLKLNDQEMACDFFRLAVVLGEDLPKEQSILNALSVKELKSWIATCPI